MMIDVERIEAVGSALTVALDEGTAEYMGDGAFVVFQEVDGETQRLTLTTDDLRRMLDMA
jgi:hypothetical protein